MIKRWVMNDLESAMRVRRGVHLTGARQVGKSTLADMLDLPNAKRFTFDDKFIRVAAAGDPTGFVKHAPQQTMVIDEVQKVPDILDAIKIVLDHDNAAGQYLLTGSSNIRFAKMIRDSLAGRLRTIRLRPLSLGEIRGNEPSFLDVAFARIFRDEYPELDKRSVLHLAFQGGYPESREYDERDRRKWHQDYLTDILTKDVSDITEIRKLSVLKEMAAWLLVRSAQFFTMDELSSRTHISKETAETYLKTLEALYLFDCVPAWAKSDYDLMLKRPKWFATDAGMMANVLEWDEDSVYLDEQRNGHFVETWVYQQLASLADATGGYAISQYRDTKKREIDFLIERTDGSVLGVEVKAGTASADDFKHLKWFGENLASGNYTGIVLYSGSRVLRFGEGYYAVPLSALGE